MRSVDCAGEVAAGDARECCGGECTFGVEEVGGVDGGGVKFYEDVARCKGWDREREEGKGGSRR